MMLHRNHIIADFREKPSGIPYLLESRGVETKLKVLKAGDYLINGQILVERKTNEDFIQSLVSNRLFNQCRRIKRSYKYPLLIIEGHPCETQYKIDPQAIKGAILSVSLSWQIPVLFTHNKEETADLLVMAGKQLAKEQIPVLRTGYKPKKPGNRKLYFVQGLPDVGPVLALRLMDRFRSVQKMINASQKELQQVEGIGKIKAAQIINFINS